MVLDPLVSKAVHIAKPIVTYESSICVKWVQICAVQGSGPMLSEIADLRNFWLHAMCAYTE